MSDLLHESLGLKVVRNPKNQFIVASLHYTADPAKRSEQWKSEASAGMREANWRKEYEIDYLALFGTKVFPQFSQYKAKIVISDPHPEFPKSNPYWGGFDWGTRNASSFHVYTVFDGIIYSVWELFEPCTNLIAFAEKMKSCPYWERIKYIAADPSIWAPTQVKGSTLVSIHDLFWEQKITKFLRGNNKEEQTFITMLNNMWSNLETEEPKFKIFSSCMNQIAELEMAVYVDQSNKLSSPKNLKEEISDYNNHSIDELKYFLLSRPQITNHKTITIPQMAKWWRT